ncbi:MAG: cell division protein FtsZ [Alphaproteobacteria bacterium]
MTVNLTGPDMKELTPRITVFGVGGAGGNAVGNMIRCNLEGVEFVIANTDSQAMQTSHVERKIQMGTSITEGLGAGSRPEVGCAAAEESLPEIIEQLSGSHMVFITAGMGGGTGTGAAPVIARAARDQGILTVGVVTKPFHFEGARRMRVAEAGIQELQRYVDTLIVIPNQNLFRIANEKTTFADAFRMADEVLHSGVRGITDLMVMPGLINLDFADVRTVMNEMGKAMMGTGEAEGDGRAIESAEAAINNPLLDEVPMKGARGVLINITGGMDMTLFEVDEAANRIRSEVDPDANIIVGSTFNDGMEGKMRVSIVATGIEDADTGRVDAVAPAAQRRGAERPQAGTAPPPPPAATGRPAPAAAPEAPQTSGGGWRPKSAVVSPDGVPGADLGRKAPPERAAPAGRGGSSYSVLSAAVDEDEDFDVLPDDADGAIGGYALNANGLRGAPEPRKPVREPEPLAADPRGGSERKRGGGLLNRVTGVSLGRTQVEPRQKPAGRELPRQSVPAPRSEKPGRPAPGDRGVSAEDKDQLEIPAFLRRQAN